MFESFNSQPEGDFSFYDTEVKAVIEAAEHFLVYAAEHPENSISQQKPQAAGEHIEFGYGKHRTMEHDCNGYDYWENDGFDDEDNWRADAPEDY